MVDGVLDDTEATSLGSNVVVVVVDAEATSPGSSVAKPDDDNTHVVVRFANADTTATNGVNTSPVVVPVDVDVEQEERGTDTAVKPFGTDTAANSLVAWNQHAAPAALENSQPASSHPNHSDS